MSRNNIVLLTIECLRQAEFRVASNVPNLHRIAQTSLEYPNFYSSSSWTAPAVSSLLTSRYPLSDGGRVSIGRHDLTVAQLLRENGYYTAGITDGWWLTTYFGYDKGFEDFFDGDTGVGERARASWRLRRLGRRLIMSRTAVGDAVNYLYRLKQYYLASANIGERLNHRALRWLGDHRGDRPFFLWVHYPGTHEPYFPPKRMAGHAFNKIWRVNRRAHKHLFARRGDLPRLTDHEISLLLDLYRAQLGQADRNIAGLLDGLAGAGCLDENTYVFITGDHGQQFFEHSGYGHGLYLYQELCNVPLLIHNTGLRGRQDERPASGLDIAPTILDIAGTTCPRRFCGRSLLGETSDGNRDIVLQEGEDSRGGTILDGHDAYLDVSKYRVALIAGRHKFIMDSHAEYELYDLETDPHEQNNLAATDVELCSALRSRLEGHLRETRSQDLEDRTRSRIQKLKSSGRV